MKSETLLMYGGAAAVVIAAYLGINSVMNANALENERIVGINKARSISALVAQDEATFGTAFRDAAMACAAGATETKLPNAVWEHYVAVFKSAVSTASDENYTPRNYRRWFIEAQRAAESENPLPDTAMAKLEAAEKAKVEAAIIEIDSNMLEIGECLAQAAQNRPS